MPARARSLDVSDLEPPEPFRAILVELATLEPGEYLAVDHRREPFPLYATLADAGYCHRSTPGGESRFQIFIWRAGDAVAQDACGPPDTPPEHGGQGGGGR